MSTNVTIVNIQSLQSSYNQYGLGQLPAGITPDDAVGSLQQAEVAAMQKNWPAKFLPFDGSQVDKGIMGPWTENVAGTAPPCLVAQIKQDFSSWELPGDMSTINAMAMQITQEIASGSGGRSGGQFYGKHNIGAETIYWSVGYAAGVIADTPQETGIIYAFAVVFGLPAN